MEKIFDPKSVAVIGATDRPGSVGLGLCKNLLEGEKQRKIYFVNPNKKEILENKAYDKITDIKGEVDLAIIAVPAEIVPQVAKETAEKKVGGVIIISAGFSETGKEGAMRERKVKDVLEKAGIPFLGPNCLGVLRPAKKLNASFAPASPQPGNIALISQSGALIDSIIDASLTENYGFSSIISLGNSAGLGLSDFLKWLDGDGETKNAAIYLEGVNDGRLLLKTLKSLSKPVVALKAGKTEAGTKAVSSHTGSLAGQREIYSAVFKETGVFEVETITELLNVSKALAWCPRFKGKVGIVTNAGGPGALTVDYCSELGLEMASLKKDTIEKLKDSPALHPASSFANPLDVVGDASPQTYEEALNTLLNDENVGALIVIQTLQIMTKAAQNAKVVAKAGERHPDKPVIGCFMGGKLTQESVKILEENNIPNYSEPREAALALKALQKNE